MNSCVHFLDPLGSLLWRLHKSTPKPQWKPHWSLWIVGCYSCWVSWRFLFTFESFSKELFGESESFSKEHRPKATLWTELGKQIFPPMPVLHPEKFIVQIQQDDSFVREPTKIHGEHWIAVTSKNMFNICILFIPSTWS